MTSPAKPEFSRPVSLNSLAQGGTSLHIEANADERARLADRFGLFDLLSLTAEITLTLDSDDAQIHLEGRLRADMVQSCVVTLEPFQTHAEGMLRRSYATTAKESQDDGDGGDSFDVDAEEPPDPIIGGNIDVGEAVAEQLALELDPFPRKSGISFADYSVGPCNNGDKSSDGGEEDETTGGPFWVLAKHKRKSK